MQKLILFTALIFLSNSTLSGDRKLLLKNVDLHEIALSDEKGTAEKQQQEKVTFVEVSIDIPWYLKKSWAKSYYDVLNVAARMGPKIDDEETKNICTIVQDLNSISALNAKLTLHRSDGVTQPVNLLALAINFKKPTIVRQLIASRADVNKIVDERLQHPLQMAVGTDDKELVQMILDGGAHINKLSWPGHMDPTSMACFKGNLAIVQLLQAKKDDYYKQNPLSFMMFAHSTDGANPTEQQMCCLKQLWIDGCDIDDARKACKFSCYVSAGPRCQVQQLAHKIETFLSPSATDTKQSVMPNNE